MVIRNTYRIIRKLGQGGMGAVYLAQHELMDEPRALKFLSQELSSDKDFTGRFLREVRNLRQVRHHNVVDSGDLEAAEDGSLFFPMEFVDGPDLRRLLHQAPKPFDVRLALELTHGIAEGLGAAHAKGIVHRDIKPENILIAREGDSVVPKIADFGVVATRELGNYTNTGSLLLTPYYAAPEQWAGMRAADLDGRTDFYALGGVLFEMLAGQKVFNAEGYPGWAQEHAKTEPEPPSSLRPELANWPGLDHFVLCLLAKDRDSRPRDVTDLLSSLNAIRGVDYGYNVGPAGFSFTPERRHDSVPRAPSSHSVPVPSSASGSGPPQPRATGPHQAEPLPGTGNTGPRPASPSRTTAPNLNQASPPSEQDDVKARVGGKQTPRWIWVVSGVVILAFLFAFVPLFRVFRGLLQPPPSSAGGTEVYNQPQPNPDHGSAKPEPNADTNLANKPGDGPDRGTAKTPKSTPPVVVDFAAVRNRASALARQERYADALPLFEQACAGGNPAACNDLGYMNQFGQGVTPNYARALTLYTKACNKGDGEGCNSLGAMFLRGIGVAPNGARAVNLFSKACDGGFGSACNNLGIVYVEGKIVPQDDARAVSLFRRSCEDSNAQGCTNLGRAYLVGRGVEKDHVKSILYLKEGCSMGDVGGCSQLKEIQ
jgi:serine/threonine protein kinase